MSTTMPCPNLESLRSFLLGTLPTDQAASVQVHIPACAACSAKLDGVHVEDSLVREAGVPPAEPALAQEAAQAAQEMMPRLKALPQGVARDLATTVDSPQLDPGVSTVDDLPLAPALSPDEIGRLGPYRILAEIGRGGMGVVFKAEDAALRPVALKVMNSDRAIESEARQRFKNEAQAAAKLTHDHIVPIYHVGEEQNVPFFVMPLLEGESLGARLRRAGRLPLAEALRIGWETAEGLAAAHRVGIIHRDIKPDNLFLEAGSDRVKILDFGLARQTDRRPELTQPGDFLGTPAYASPEQVRGDTPVDSSSDLFSLGCVLYAMATGERPFQGQTRDQVRQAVLQDSPRPPRDLNPGLPAAFSDLVMRLLDKDAKARPTSQAVVEALRRLESRRSARLWWVGVAAAVLLVGIAAVMAGARLHPGKPADTGTPGTEAGQNGPAAPLRALLDVRVWKDKQALPLRLHQLGALPVKAGQFMRVEVELDRPAYLYVIYLDSRGKPTPLYPWRSDDWQDRPAEESRRQRLWLPDAGQGAPLSAGPSGIESYILLARDEPLPADVDLSKLFAGLAPQQGLADLPMAAWFRDGQLVRDEADRGPIRLGQAEVVNDPLGWAQAAQEQLWQRLQPHFQQVRAACFSFRGE
jgi:hypothetical protein